MTVQELIEKLATLPEDAPVHFRIHELSVDMRQWDKGTARIADDGEIRIFDPS
jgi:hypothetical protein